MTSKNCGRTVLQPGRPEARRRRNGEHTTAKLLGSDVFVISRKRRSDVQSSDDRGHVSDASEENGGTLEPHAPSDGSRVDAASDDYELDGSAGQRRPGGGRPRRPATQAARGEPGGADRHRQPRLPRQRRCARLPRRNRGQKTCEDMAHDVGQSVLATSERTVDRGHGNFSRALIGVTTVAAVSLLASHQGDPGSIPGRVNPDFRMWESCRTMPLVGGFSRGSPVSPGLSFRRCSIPRSPSSALKTVQISSLTHWLLLSLIGTAVVDNNAAVVLGSPGGLADLRLDAELKDKEVAEAVNLELVNMNPNNGSGNGNGISLNGIPVKKEPGEDVSEGYADPYDEYFVPVNEHRKYMRVYVNILKEQLISVKVMGLTKGYRFTQDSDPKHMALITLLWLLYNAQMDADTTSVAQYQSCVVPVHALCHPARCPLHNPHTMSTVARPLCPQHRPAPHHLRTAGERELRGGPGRAVRLRASGRRRRLSPVDAKVGEVRNHPGEKLYVTKDKRRSQSWGRLILMGICCIVVAAAIVIGALAATGVILSQQEAIVGDAAITSRQFSGSASPVIEEESNDVLPEVSSYSPPPHISHEPDTPPTTETNQYYGEHMKTYNLLL
ncbi:hypothetical protein PR048_028167 [Dryococelus australis]|uniref:Uncharacterized protein n=1 Tax=Dryococelus australis TaxID=614101 RepID=A0ABQ9GIJ7_9NEOP|nr:hypothetical protein PR048_028167 [Dryococelus australis]